MQAGQAHHFGMSEEGALKAITTAPARRMGLDHRIGCKFLFASERGKELILIGW